MDAGDFEAFADGLKTLAHAMRTEITELQIEAYWVALRDMDRAALLGALARGMRAFDEFPRPVALRREARAVAQEIASRADGARASRRTLPAQRWTYLLAELADPDVPESKKNRLRQEWRALNPSETPPWEGAA